MASRSNIPPVASLVERRRDLDPRRSKGSQSGATRESSNQNRNCDLSRRMLICTFALSLWNDEQAVRTARQL